MRLLSALWQQSPLHQHLRDLHRVRRRPLAQVVRHHPEIEAVRHCRIAADAAYEDLVAALAPPTAVGDSLLEGSSNTITPGACRRASAPVPE